MENKKEEHDTLEKLSEKDLWCQDLDAFVSEWELQLKEEEDYQKTIRNTNRRASRKIGAGKNGGKGRPKASAADTEYNPKPLKANPNKGIVKVEPPKQHERFLSMFKGAQSKAKPNANSMGSDGADEVDQASGLSDDDFETLKATKPASKDKESSASRSTSEQPGPSNARGKRAAAAAPKKWVIDDDEESESDDGKFLGDVGDMVKGIGSDNKTDNAATNGRLSLFAMSRPGSSHGKSVGDLPKVKSKPSKTFNISDDDDETNYEMLAKSSPHKAPPEPRDNLDSFLSDDDDLVPMIKKAPVKAPAPKPAAPKVVPKAAPKAKKAPAPKKVAEPSQPKPVQLSPAAKAYAAKQSKMNLAKKAFSEDEDEDVKMDDDDEESPPPKPAARGRGRPARAAAVTKPKTSIYVDSDDDEMDIDDNDESALVEDEPSDDFDESD
jgi:DNA topoisomerase-2